VRRDPHRAARPSHATRLDQRLKRDQPSLSWARARAAIERGQVAVDGVIERDPGAIVAASAGVTFDVNRPADRPARARFTCLYEDDHLLVLDKPAGLLSIADGAERSADQDTVLSRVREYMARRRGPGGYVGTLHRLDRDTSGALAMALSRAAHESGRALFGRHAFERRYVAVVAGVPDPTRGTIDRPLATAYASGRRRIAAGGEPSLRAVTHYVVEEAFGTAAATLDVSLETGRQHQIRVHLAHVGHPLLGDRVYGTTAAAAAAPRQMLHARTLAFPHPITGTRVAVEAPLPDDVTALLARLRSARRRDRA
jgi:23S rRNA pseudouridine1911/1915/1917 synthase